MSLETECDGGGGCRARRALSGGRGGNRDGLRFNQPAGHLEQGESLVPAVAREALEETAHRFRPEFLVGIYQWPSPAATSPTCVSFRRQRDGLRAGASAR
jgi:8-oxo-dGTP pyrophosphatase MutT (NUDIX family)